MADEMMNVSDVSNRNKFHREKSSVEGEYKKYGIRGNKKSDTDLHNFDMSSDDSLTYRNLSGDGNKNYGLRKRSRADFYERPRFHNRDSNRSKLSRYHDGERLYDDSNNINYPNKKGRYNSINYNGNNISNNLHFIGELTRSSLYDVVARMNTFKEFMLTMDDNIHPEDAVDAYFEYVKTFSTKQLDPFFKNYNECDWMMLRYHPLWKDKERNFVRKCYQIRMDIFNKLLNGGYMDEIVLDSSNVDTRKKLYNLLIFLNILLEGGSFEEIEECEKLLEHVESDTKQFLKEEKDDELDMDKNDEYEEKDIKFLNNDIIDNEPNVEGRHRIISFNIKAVPIDTTREELYKCYGNIEGFLRAYISEPTLGKRDFRRAFLTFKPDVDILKVTNELNTIKFRENITLFIRQSHELNRRVRCQELKTGCNNSKKTLIFDTKMVYDLINDFDNKYEIYNEIEQIMELNEVDMEDETTKSSNLFNYSKLLSEEDENQFNNIQLIKENPIIDQLKLMVEKIEKLDDSLSIEENEIKKVLDISILYLRIVYSIDYYGLIEYPYEHLRNIRCSTITIRDSKLEIGTLDDQILNISEDESMEIYYTDVKNKFKQILDEIKMEEDSDNVLMQLKIEEKEIEDFIEQNTQKITDQKFLCPLSMKKFKSPEYVRKHILTKHVEKIEKIKTDVIYFNNFVKSKYKNLPFGVDALKRRNKFTTNKLNLHNNKSVIRDRDSLNTNSRFTKQSLQTITRNSKSYGRYRDLDSRESMFDL